MKLKIIDKQEGDEFIILTLGNNNMFIDYSIEKHNDEYWRGGTKIAEISDNIITYLHPDYQIYIDF